jgi:phosphopantothenate-cysteine ligase
MKVLITAGGTTEPIDSVRAIVNRATGRLGSLIAQRWLREPSVERVFYVAPRRAERPAGGAIEWIETVDTASVEQAVSMVLTQERIDAVIHSMAISDYRVRTVTTVERVAGYVSDRLAGQVSDHQAGVHPEAGGSTPATGDPSSWPAALSPEHLAGLIEGAPGLAQTDKMSSYERHPLLLLEPTPKIIRLFAEMAPAAVLVGFKLLSGVSYEALLAAAAEVRDRNGCRFVLANDLRTITGDQHVGYLLDRAGQVRRFDNKAAIADGIVAAVLDDMAGTRQRTE